MRRHKVRLTGHISSDNTTGANLSPTQVSTSLKCTSGQRHKLEDNTNRTPGFEAIVVYILKSKLVLHILGLLEQGCQKTGGAKKLGCQKLGVPKTGGAKNWGCQIFCDTCLALQQ